MAKHKFTRPDPLTAWWLPPADKLEAAGFRCDVGASAQGSTWSWYSSPGEAGGWHIYLGIHGNGWLFIYNTKHQKHTPPQITTVPDGPKFTELLREYGWRPAPKPTE